jgi:hypothetical protein
MGAWFSSLATSRRCPQASRWKKGRRGERKETRLGFWMFGSTFHFSLSRWHGLCDKSDEIRALLSWQATFVSVAMWNVDVTQCWVCINVSNSKQGEMKFSTEKKSTLCIYTEADYSKEKVTALLSNYVYHNAGLSYNASVWVLEIDLLNKP